jgi:4-diphosphocytidyl-2-C-methyl-D-erythritol kinase
VLKAARAVAARIPDIVLGAFTLEKNLPVAAGLGGGSADAAAALRLIARANDLRPGDPRLYEAARATGADVPVCLDPRSRVMSGIGDELSEALTLPPLPALLVNPGAAVPTKQVFAGWTPTAKTTAALDIAALAKVTQQEELLQIVAAQPNDLESAAIAVAPVIADVLAALRLLLGCELARMSGSGATCFGLFSSVADGAAAAKALSAKYPDWWVCETTLG